MDFETALKIELHFARREEKTFRERGDEMNAERWHMVGEAFQRSLDIWDKHKQTDEEADNG